MMRNGSPSFTLRIKSCVKATIGTITSGRALVAVIIERQPWVRRSAGGKWDWDLGKIRVSVAPKDGAPGLIEGVERWIPAAQPLLESFPAKTAIAAGAF